MSFRLRASYISKAHTVFASSAFISALLLGLRLHYRKIVKNEVAGYPDEWWPSVSATIGDWYPERRFVFQILIALTAGPRFALIFCWWLLTRSTASTLPNIVAVSGIARTFACGGWVYITSSDDHDAHDVLMISYMALNLPWMVGSILCTPLSNTASRRHRKFIATCFFVAIVPMVYLFIEHKVHKVPGAYTRYSFFEWFLIFSDIWFDSITGEDFSVLEISVSYASTEMSPPKMLSPTRNAQPIQVDAPQSPSSGVVRKPHASSKDAQTPATTPRVPVFPRHIKLVLPRSWRYVLAFSADVYLAYVWWSIFTSLAVTLFYFSVWQLAIAGQEVSLISTLSPVFLASPSVRAALTPQKGRTWLHVASITGLVAYRLENPLHRLFAVAFANVSGALLKAIEWSDEKQAERYGLTLALGLAFSSLSKLVNHSNNPIWPIVDDQSGGWNKTGILLAALAIWQYATRDSRDAVLSNRDTASRSEKGSDTVAPTPPPFPSAIAPSVGVLDHWSFSSISLGGLLFSLHCLLTDSGTLIAWAWTGYPIQGQPLPGFHGYLTLIATSLGIVIASSALRHVVRHPPWMILGAIAAYFMYRWRGWPGYIAGLFLATFLTSIIPEIIKNAARHGKHSPGKVYFTTWLVVCLFDLANVWTVAYAFVPAGWILRERTDIVLAMQLVAVGLGLLPGWHNLSSPPWTSTKPAFRRHARKLSASLILTSFLYTTHRFPVKTPLPHHADQRLITAGIWTVHFGIDDAGRDSQRRMRDLIKDMELDVVGLLETDLHRVVFGNRDLTRVIVEDLGYYIDVGPGPNFHTWGAALLSKFPIIQSTHHLLPSPHGELAPAISAVLDVWGQNVTVIVSHNGQEEDALDRELQSTELARIMASTYPDPVIFLGYVVSKPLAKRPDPYEILVTDGLMNDIDDEDWDRWCEYILYRGLYRVSYARVSRSTITDTELQVGKFVVPKTGHPVINASREDRYLRSYREVLPSSIWFPDDFLDRPGGKPGGTRGHYYHVHPWPLYYALPNNAVV